MKKTILFLFGLLFSLQTLASEALRLYEWSPGTTLAPIILPVRKSETPEQAATRYLKELAKNPDLMELFEGKIPELPMTGFRPLDNESREHRALLIANLPKDYAKNSQRIINFKKIFSQTRHSTFILPMNANLGLSLNETRDLFKQVSEKFPFLVAMGGDDVETRLYKQENFHARNTIAARDQFEVALIKSYVAQEKGFVLGICRGSQITSVALGYQLIQDVPFQIGHKMNHSDNYHDIEVQATRSNLLKSLADANGRMSVYSYHHQSVIFKEGGPLDIAAKSHDGVTEATEFKNGRGLLMQFHPEFMNNELGAKILWKTVAQKNKVMPLRCSKIF